MEAPPLRHSQPPTRRLGGLELPGLERRQLVKARLGPQEAGESLEAKGPMHVDPLS